MSGPINGAAPVGDSLQARILRNTETLRIATGWTEILKREKQSAGLFSLQLPQCEQTSLAIGCLDEHLRELGYFIVSISHFIMGKDSNGMLALSIHFLVRSKDGKAVQIVLG